MSASSPDPLVAYAQAQPDKPAVIEDRPDGRRSIWTYAALAHSLYKRRPPAADAQGMLLRFLQTGEGRPVGAERAMQFDVRVIDHLGNASASTDEADAVAREIRKMVNVAVSRAMCLAFVVASPRLLESRARTIEQMRAGLWISLRRRPDEPR
jgi:hypothetical protein